MNKIKKSIIFDMDGTLVDSGNVIANTINYVRNKFNLEPIDKKHLLTCVNNPKINSALFFYGCDTITKKHKQLFDDYYKKHCISDIILYDGILDLLKILKDKFILTIATNAKTIFAKQMICHLNIQDYFVDIIGADQVVNAKPHPDMINELIKRNNFDKNQTILIGDSYKDVLSAKNANIDYILVNWGFSNHKSQEALNDVSQLKLKLLNFNDNTTKNYV
jgi:phosphoglycolate phosphatase